MGMDTHGFLNAAPTTLPRLRTQFDNLKPGTPIKEVTKDDILFEKLKSDAEKAAEEAKKKAAAAPP
ncbi:hypothetical protein As57867_017416, partial [Aphanomyces stellatus]